MERQYLHDTLSFLKYNTRNTFLIEAYSKLCSMTHSDQKSLHSSYLLTRDMVRKASTDLGLSQHINDDKFGPHTFLRIGIVYSPWKWHTATCALTKRASRVMASQKKSGACPAPCHRGVCHLSRIRQIKPHHL